MEVAIHLAFVNGVNIFMFVCLKCRGISSIMIPVKSNLNFRVGAVKQLDLERARMFKNFMGTLWENYHRVDLIKRIKKSGEKSNLRFINEPLTVQWEK